MTLLRPHLMALGLLAVAWLARLTSPLSDLISDQRFLWPERSASGTIVLVDIDAPSLAQLGVWPLPRRHHARLIEQLTAAGASGVFFDVDFSARSNPDNDAAFAEALTKAGGSVVLATFQQRAGALERGSARYVNRPLPEFAQQSWSAVVNVLPEKDGLVRRYALGAHLDVFTPSLGALAADRHDGQGPPFRIDFSIRADTVPTVSYAAILDGDPQAMASVKDRKVIIGGTAIELGDRFNVPNGRVIPGSMLQLLAAESLLQGRDLQRSSLPLSLAGALVIVGVMMAVWRRTAVNMRFALVLGLAVAVEGGAFAIQARWPIAIDTALWHVLLCAYLVAIALDEIDLRGLLRGIAERRFERIAMSLGDGLACLDADGRIVVWNPGATRIFGYSEEQALGRPFSDCLGGVPSALTNLMALGELAAEAAATDQVLDLVGRRADGETFALEASVSGWSAAQGRQIGLVLRDVTVKQRERERIRYLADHDDLTDLLNRRAFDQQVSAQLGRADSLGPTLVLIGIERFHQLGDIHGQDFADAALMAFANRIEALMPPEALAARIADDEFALAVPRDLAGPLITAITRDIGAAPLVFGRRRQQIAVRLGYAIPQPGWSADQLIGNAHLALDTAMTNRAEQAIAFEPTMRDRLSAQIALEAELRVAFEKEEFELFYQPQLRLSDGAVIGAEALIRWRHPERGLVPPGQFMPVLNASSLSDQVAGWVLATGCRQARLWEIAGTPIRVGVNLSPSQVQGGGLEAAVGRELDASGLTPELLELEVTEDILVEDSDMARIAFAALRARGVQMAFDDFGTGYGSLSYLKAFPLDTLKIDQSFVRQLLTNENDAAIVRATIDLGHSLGLEVIAEGIEDARVAERLASMGCDEGQGYHFAKPMAADDFESLFLRQRGRPPQPLLTQVE